MKLIDGISQLLSKKSAVQMVADDPHLAAEILLLLRMMYADGKTSGEELALFKSMCGTLFGIKEKEVAEVVKYLADFGYETTGEQAASMFKDLDEDRKREVLVHLITMARADTAIHEDEAGLIARVADVLGFREDDVRFWLADT